MLGKDYISLNGEKIPNPTGVKIKYTNNDNVKVSEEGGDVGTTGRLLKRTISFSFDSSSRGRDKIKHYCSLPQIVMTFNGVEMTGRLRMNDSGLMKNSEYMERTDGLWTLGVVFMEK